MDNKKIRPLTAAECIEVKQFIRSCLAERRAGKSALDIPVPREMPAEVFARLLALQRSEGE